jgi:hypothetical protein
MVVETSDFKGSGLLGGLTNLLYKEVLGVYGFQEGDIQPEDLRIGKRINR